MFRNYSIVQLCGVYKISLLTTRRWVPLLSFCYARALQALSCTKDIFASTVLALRAVEISFLACDDGLYKFAFILHEPKSRYGQFWLDLGRRLARLPARPSAQPCLYPRARPSVLVSHAPWLSSQSNYYI